eukprot:jgi/Orpsp1_1/1189099/evm.model.d7180000069494.1
MLTIFIFILCYLTLSSAFKDVIYKESIIINENDKIKNLYVCNNCEFTVYIKSTSYDYYYWAIENFEEIKNYNIEPLNLVSYYDDEFKEYGMYDDIPNKGEIITLNSNENNNDFSFFKFKFKINNSTLEDLPQLKFVDKEKFNDIDNNGEHQVQVNLIADDIGYVSTMKDIIIYPEIEANNSEQYLILDDNNMTFSISLIYEVTEDYNNLFLYSDYSWYLDNMDNDILSVYRYNKINISGNKFEISESYVFKVNNLTEKDILPIRKRKIFSPKRMISLLLNFQVVLELAMYGSLKIMMKLRHQKL